MTAQQDETLDVEQLDPRFIVFTVRDVLTPDECRALIEETEAMGYLEAPITTDAGFVVRRDIRNNTRVVDDNEDRASWLFQKLRAALPERIGRWEVTGLNERFRFYRYDPGQRFNWHRDGAYVRHPMERSKLTLLVYLNGGDDGFSEEPLEGGETTIEGSPGEITVAPRLGLALVFDHGLLHIGTEVTAGRKYVMRTDVMTRHMGG